MAHTRKKSHGVRNFLLFIVICTIVVFAIQKTVSIFFPFRYTEYINQYAQEFNLERHLVMGIIKTESNFDPKAVSKSEAKGLMQLTDSTAGDCAKKLGLNDFFEEQLFDPEMNIYLGCYYLSYLMDRFDGETETALAAYNAGEGNVRSWLSDSRYSSDGKTLHTIPYPETSSYIKKIRLYQNVYQVLDQWSNGNN